MSLDDESTVVIINRKTEKVIHFFRGGDYDFAMQVYNQMKKAYSRLPEFDENYVRDTYMVTRVYFEGDKALDRYR